MSLRFQALVAEDDPEMLRSVKEAVEQLGAEVTAAATGDELIQHLAEADFDVVVTDVSMPWMTGVQAMQAARTAGLAVPIVVMTALRDERIAEQVRALGHDATLLYKPFGIEQLHSAIHSVLHPEPA